MGSIVARSYEVLDQVISEALNALTIKNTMGWFTHCGYYVAANASDCSHSYENRYINP
ncbi:MAG: hypothetical protein HC851_24590 [Acaryochloris sp. RU_4_1]|nr:hypothetical protein [Acaryochloris sp. RU_4_1]NJR54158.1 hypothetical protein [Acaryochloris sp. CRU_2_0]